MPDQLADLQDKITAMECELRGRWRDLAKLTPTVARIYNEYEQEARALQVGLNTAKVTAERYRDDDTMYPEGRRRLIAETIDKGRQEHDAHAAKMRALLELMKAEIANVATPRVDSTREMAARDELRLILDNAADPIAAMAQVVQRGGELAGVACSSYGESYLRAKGTRNPREAHADILAVARASAVNSEDPTLRAAAEVHHAVGGSDGLDASLATTMSVARTTLRATEDAGAGL